MIALLILAMVGPIDLATQGNFEAAIAANQEQLKDASLEDSFQIFLNIGDLYLYWLYQPDSALIYYEKVKERFEEDSLKLGITIYRMGHANELSEDYQTAAKCFSDVVTKFREFCPSYYSDQALAAVDRCFHKNYQELLAKVDNWPITRIEIDAEIDEMPSVMRVSYQSPEKIKQLIDRKIIDWLLEKYCLKHRYDTIPDVRNRIFRANKRYMMDDILARDIYSKITVTDAEIKKYYDENREKYRIKAKAKIKEIVVQSESLANWLHGEISADTSRWDSLCKIYSTAPSKHSGGSLGYMAEGARPGIEDSIFFATEIGKITPVVQLDTNKFAFYKVLDKKPGRDRKLDEVKRLIRSSIYNDKKKKMTEAYLDSLFKLVKSEYFLDGERGDTLVKFDHHFITELDVKQKKEEIPPFQRSDYSKRENLKDLLEDMVKQELRFITAFRKHYYIFDSTFTNFLDNRKREMLGELWQREIVAKAKLTEREIKRYYQEHLKDEFTVPAQIRLRGIITKDSAYADSLYHALRYRPWWWPFSYRFQTEIYDSLINHYSLTPDTVRSIRGVDFGYMMKGSKPIVDSLVFPLSKNTIARPIYNEADSTYTLYLVVDKKPVRIIRYDQAKTGIERNLKRKKLNARRDEFLERLKAQAKIEYFLPEEEEEEEKK
ncbi:MAG TPA: peptidyl-prolyl cis-trans isomerase [bacterium (Candidatus Stahlbacteria)]|nr:peptidyl-prolyl cis-trans isomerase [Candidatus Stahlbacteria bacterium]